LIFKLPPLQNVAVHPSISIVIVIVGQSVVTISFVIIPRQVVSAACRMIVPHWSTAWAIMSAFIVCYEFHGGHDDQQGYWSTVAVIILINKLAENHAHGGSPLHRTALTWMGVVRSVCNTTYCISHRN